MTDSRNVIDYFKYWEQDSIRAELDKDRAPLAVTMEHWQGDFNIGGVVRNGNAFNVEAIHYVGRRQWDRRGAVGTHHYSSIIHSPTVEEWFDLIKGKYETIVAFDNIDGAIPIDEAELPESCMMVFGEESIGITPDILQFCDNIIYIKQYGSVRSLNAGVASGIAMYEWARRHR